MKKDVTLEPEGLGSNTKSAPPKAGYGEVDFLGKKEQI